MYSRTPWVKTLARHRTVFSPRIKRQHDELAQLKQTGCWASLLPVSCVFVSNAGRPSERESRSGPVPGPSPLLLLLWDDEQWKCFYHSGDPQSSRGDGWTSFKQVFIPVPKQVFIPVPTKAAIQSADNTRWWVEEPKPPWTLEQFRNTLNDRCP